MPINKRSKNWTFDEEQLLVRLCKENYQRLFGNFNSGLTNQDRKRTWAKIADDVTSLGTARSDEDCRIKYTKIKSVAKKKAAANHSSFHKTGGGDQVLEDLSPIEEMALSSVPQISISGIQDDGDGEDFLLWNEEVGAYTLIYNPDNNYAPSSQSAAGSSQATAAQATAPQGITAEGTTPQATAPQGTIPERAIPKETTTQRVTAPSAEDVQALATASSSATAIGLEKAISTTSLLNSVAAFSSLQKRTSAAKKKQPTRLDLQETYVDNISTFTSAMLDLMRNQNEELGRMTTAIDVLNCNLSHFIEYMCQREM